MEPGGCISFALVDFAVEPSFPESQANVRFLKVRIATQKSQRKLP
jgi:hypothetical protein